MGSHQRYGMREDIREDVRKNVRENVKKDVRKDVREDVRENVREDIDRAVREDIKEKIKSYEKYLYDRERHPNTVKKYMHDVRSFFLYVQDKKEEEKEVSEGNREEQISGREWVLQYKEYLIGRYKISSINSMLTALNGYLKFIGRNDCCVQLYRAQRRIFREEEKELSQDEYRRLVLQAEQEGNLRMSGILQTIGSTGIRISELEYITAEVLKKGMACVRSKGKERYIILPPSLVALLEEYCVQANIRSGSIFVTRTGRPVDRRNVWAEMKRLCRAAGILEDKGFPHNLRHLFAQTYYEKEKDIVRLADYLGHSNVETTRRYTMVSSMQVCLRQLELGMLVEGHSGRRIWQRFTETHVSGKRGCRKRKL